AAIRAVAPAGVDGLFDAAAQERVVLPALIDGGGLAEFLGWDGPSERGITIHPIVGTAAATDTPRLERLRDQVEDGTLTLRVAAILPAKRAAEAHRRLAAGGVRGRLVLDFSNR
ncbi:MAG TPA: zinc-binding dehydrogenase, partial [Chloroflexota bacterium]|nr:zinc-binding dehydrogenase [Chloroflexota bacterium]